MSSLIVADTGPLIALAKIDQLDLLRHFYKKISIPETVFAEATQDLSWHDASRIHVFVEQYVEVALDKDSGIVKELFMRLDAGESQALALADAMNCPVLLDERRGRTVAKQMNISIVGTVGLLVKAKQEGLIVELRKYLIEMTEHGYRLSPALIQQALKVVGENY
jgi:predicted nucleic acid-binding protein